MPGLRSRRSLRKPRLAQAVIEALAILGALADLRKDRLVDQATEMPLKARMPSLPY